MDYEKDTICAIATPYGIGAIGIIRVSGKESFKITDRIFKGGKTIQEFRSHTINYGHIIDSTDRTMVDEVMVVKMEGPRSFTGENVVEINCHGSPFILKRVMELLLREGARAALPGEFTKRAFFNGKLDLAEAEAVADVINAETNLSAHVSLKQLKGSLSKEINDIRNGLISLIAQIDATLDFPEEDLDALAEIQVKGELESIGERLDRLYKSYDRGKFIKKGIKIVIAGRANVGKSTLLNELTGHMKAIVTEIPGTTRDLIEETIYIKGVPVTLIDTAGIRDTGDVVERIGVDLAKEAIDDGDLVLVVVDSSRDITAEDEEILKLVKDKRIIVVINKIDLLKENGESADETRDKLNKILTDDGLTNVTFIKTSLTKKLGLAELEKILGEFLIKEGELGADRLIVTNIRHAELIGSGLESIRTAINSMGDDMPLDLITVDIREALDYFGQIIGEYPDDEILDEIFKRFCIGK